MGKGKSTLTGLRVLLGVSGGVAAYKAVELASKLTAAGASVRTVMTESATHLVGAKSFEAVTASPVYTDLWSTTEQHEIGHVALADWADIVVVAPATANIIGKAASGICDDLLSTALCTCWTKPTLIAPAMNDNMWTNPVVQRNAQAVEKIGVVFVGPRTGRLACGKEAIGRMAEPQEIIETIEKMAPKLKRRKK
jgi:phosphopantothenoylcysteine decarboxylase/phosphopantothenate--cysteine ligase